MEPGWADSTVPGRAVRAGSYFTLQLGGGRSPGQRKTRGRGGVPIIACYKNRWGAGFGPPSLPTLD